MSKPASDTSINAPINASIHPKQKELLLFSVKRCRTPELIQESDYAALRDHGYDEEDILDMSGITAFFGLFNRMAIVMNMQSKEAFYS